jgi:hypothetical protein
VLTPALQRALVDVVATATRDGEGADLLVEVEAASTRHAVAPDDLLDALERPELVRAVQDHVHKARQRGDLLREQVLPAIEKLIATADRLAAEDAIAPAVLPRMLDTLFKLTGLAEERAVRLRVEAAAQAPMLTLNILEGDTPAPPESGGLTLTIISPSWQGGRQERVIEHGVGEDGGDHG